MIAPITPEIAPKNTQLVLKRKAVLELYVLKALQATPEEYKHSFAVPN